MKPTYVLGTGLSHDGSACLLKDGKICVAIEKERITRVKHDGFNDTHAIRYCLDAEGITLKDVDLIVQNANYGMFEYGNEYFDGHRLFQKEIDVPLLTISHHLAHAYYGLGTCNFDETAILVLDGCGSLMDEVIDLNPETQVPEKVDKELRHLYAEKDSYYLYESSKCKSVFKDFSPFGYLLKMYPLHPQSTKHSIGGIYGAGSHYCLGDSSDLGKLMGLAPYGRKNVYDFEIFSLSGGRVFVNYDWMHNFRQPVRQFSDFQQNFQYYADLAYWIQKETERAVLYLVNARYELMPTDNLCFTGGVALNAVANSKLLKQSKFKDIYFTPAAGDNGLAIGCAYYGWLEVLKREKVSQGKASSFGITYPENEIHECLSKSLALDIKNLCSITSAFKSILQNSKHFPSITDPYTIQLVIIGSMNQGFEFTPDQCTVTDHPITNPNCTLIIDGLSFIRFLNNPTMPINAIHHSQDIGSFVRILVDLKISEEIKRSLQQTPQAVGINYTIEKDISMKTAQLLAEGKIIGWFQGRSEFGPRALGFRSILADPRKEGVRDFINSKIKFREEFRPFAPSVLEEDANKYFELKGESPYMLVVTELNEGWKDKFSSITHVDNSSRVQTVSKEWDERYYNLLQNFKQLTGLSIVLNTSLNKKGMPIVETPQEALSFFYECALDAIAIGDHLVTKEN